MRTYRPKYTVDGVVHTSQRWWIDLHDHRGIRRRLAGLADRRATEAIGRNIERLVRYVAAGDPPDPALAKWLTDWTARGRPRVRHAVGSACGDDPNRLGGGTAGVAG